MAFVPIYQQLRAVEQAATLSDADFAACLDHIDVRAPNLANYPFQFGPVIYIAACSTGHIKIGESCRVGERLRYAAGPLVPHKPMRVLACARGGDGVERRIHRRLAHYCIGHEVYRPHGDVAGFVFDVLSFLAQSSKRIERAA